MFRPVTLFREAAGLGVDGLEGRLFLFGAGRREKEGGKDGGKGGGRKNCVIVT